MPEGQEPRFRERSVSGDLEDTETESHTGDANPPGKPGRKKNPNSQAARRDQNRIAQREFRLRKQQRIRDLEARVEILSGGKDEALGEMRNMLKDLMAENQTLRNLLRSLANFIGEGAGGLLPKLGWGLSDFNEFINKSETDTAWEGYQRRKKLSDDGETSSPLPQMPMPSSGKRPSDSDLGNRPKKMRPDPTVEAANNFSLLIPMPNSSIPSSAGLYSNPPSRLPERNSLFSDILRPPNGSPMFMQAPSTSSPQYPPNGSNIDGFQPSSNYNMSGVNVNVEQPVSSSSPYDSPSSAPVSHQRMQSTEAAPAPEDNEEEDDPKKAEAYKLIHYHLDNYKRNSSYCLPASLRPTVVQRTIPHESAVDCVLHPDLRDRMILYRQKIDLAECFIDLRQAVTIHGDDVLAHQSWEIGEKFLRKYSFLIDTETLKVTNHWRRERGEAEIHLPEQPIERTT
ncbi:hypothetical protein CVT24_002064 [Panaeolus cyanescens]|uniref:BZIP domain-containing protein n=1 Tax=Panaeolus cyanescens TaxID=181874 RepID=A0A409W1J7_9AGAR|nr:hypothetical protein CVT24_002064 [Panaeolus cyanescens]